MQQHYSILEYKHGRFLKLALWVCALVIGVYAFNEPPAMYRKPYGGTGLGYTLGTVAALLIVWLMLLGIRKRRYHSSIGTVQGWTSAHIYLGTSLVVIATLHCAFEFGWNIHTLAYVLMMTVVASGFFGVFAYVRYPTLATRNLAGESIEAMMLNITDLDKKCRRIALDLPDEINAIVMTATRAPRPVARPRLVGTHFYRELRGNAVPCPTRAASERLMSYRMQGSLEQSKGLSLLLTEMTRKTALISRVRRDIQLRALMQIWLFFHVPLSFALLAALTAHIVSVFYFW